MVSATLSRIGTCGCASCTSAKVNCVHPLPVTSLPLLFAFTCHTVGLVTPCTVRFPSMSKLCSVFASGIFAPVIDVGTNTTVGYCSVSSVLVSGTTAANALGLSMPVPGRITFLTDGSPIDAQVTAT